MTIGKELEKKSRYMSKLLRHNPEELKINEEGWVSTEELCAKLKINLTSLDQIVKENDKQRFIFNEDKSKIRANQGHSINVDLNLTPQAPPNKLYHGTSKESYEIIKNMGIQKMKRQHVHLSASIETAIKVGIRHCRADVFPAVCIIDAETMHKDGFKFYLSENKVWLTDNVPSKYLIN